MSTINGCGTKILGNFEYYEDGSCLKIKFLVVFFIPIVPLICYRVFDANEEQYNLTMPIGTFAKSKYRVIKIPMKWKHAWQLLRIIYLMVVVGVGFVVLMGEMINKPIWIIVCILGILTDLILGVRYLINKYD